MKRAIASLKRHPLATFVGLTFKTISGGLVSQMFEGADSVHQGWSLAIVWVMAAIGVVLLTGMNLGRLRVEQREAITTPISAS